MLGFPFHPLKVSHFGGSLVFGSLGVVWDHCLVFGGSFHLAHEKFVRNFSRSVQREERLRAGGGHHRRHGPRRGVLGVWVLGMAGA